MNLYDLGVLWKKIVKGALGATLLIWLVYAAGFGIFIFVLTRLFKLL